MSDHKLATESRRRCSEWQALVADLLSPFSEAAEADAEFLLALVDGLGLNIVRGIDGDAGWALQQSKRLHVLDRALNQFRD